MPGGQAYSNASERQACCGYPLGRRVLGGVDFSPGVVWRERSDFVHEPSGLRSEILLKYGAVLIHNEGHDAGIAIFGRVSNERKAADHLILSEVVISATASGRALPCQDAVVIAMIRNWGAAGLVALGCSLRSEIAKRARLFSLCGRPIKSVLLSGTAYDPLCVDTSALTRRIE